MTGEAFSGLDGIRLGIFPNTDITLAGFCGVEESFYEYMAHDIWDGLLHGVPDNDAVARCALWDRMALWVVDDFFANVAKTIYDTDKATGLEYAEGWGVDVKLFA